ncbi:reductase [Enterococcus sp. JM4C]|uniref:NADPH-dependent FMN reductase n=1 Tax=Candidatus Enterococcus huntleyi TaxID=1857217 RepID=UPI00137A1573|nr:NAD(P)H-dependent oxidoreductase [Enterococcus sp. JM4C]KAF1299277.1 reductase [Enterococcus sp. JM4C]
MKFGIILGSTREGRVSPQVGEYIKQIASAREGHEFEIVDVKEYDLPFMGTGTPNAAWNEKINELDGYIFIVQEYNHGMASSLKNALDSARDEWFNKAAGIVSYGSGGGIRAAEQVRLVLAEQKVADVRTNPAFNLFTDFENFSEFKPGEHMAAGVNDMLDELLLWSQAMKGIRA